MTAPATLGIYAFQFGPSPTGFVINDVPQADGTVFDVTGIEGLGSDQVKTLNKSYDGGHGGIINNKWDDIRKIMITGTVFIGSSSSVTQTLEKIRGAFSPDWGVQPLFYQGDGGDLRQIFCKASGVQTSWTTAMRTGQTPFVITLYAEDPRIYNTVQQQGQASYVTPGTAPGRPFPYTFPYTFGGPNTGSGFAQLISQGTRDTPITITLQGYSVSNPKFIDHTHNRMIALALSIQASDTLILNSKTRSVLLNGQSQRGAVTTEGWFDLSYQNGCVVEFAADYADVGATAVITWYDAYR